MVVVVDWLSIYLFYLFTHSFTQSNTADEFKIKEWIARATQTQLLWNNMKLTSPDALCTGSLSTKLQLQKLWLLEMKKISSC